MSNSLWPHGLYSLWNSPGVGNLSPLQGIFETRGSNPGLKHCRRILPPPPHLFLLVGGSLLYNIVVVFVIHWHESAMDLHVFPIPIPPPASLSARSLWVFPVHQPWALISCIQPGLVACFTIDNIHVSMLFSRNIPPSPSPTESESLFCTSVSLSLFCTQGYLVPSSTPLSFILQAFWLLNSV